MTPAEWLADQTRRHGGCWYYPCQPVFYSREAEVRGPDGVLVSNGHSLGVARARANRLNMQIAKSVQTNHTN